MNAQHSNTNNWHSDEDSNWNDNWNDQTDRAQAQRMTDDQYPDWQSIDAQDDGNNYKVHMRDGQGHFRTVMIDHYFKAMRTVDGYC